MLTPVSGEARKNAMSPKVSVVLPVYNGGRYLADCLDTILGQTLRDIEIIAINDGSTDNSFHILKEYERRDSRLCVFNQDNYGAGYSRNFGISEAKGEYLSFLDSDDTFELNMLEKAYTASKKNDLDICIFKSNGFDGETGTMLPMEWALREELLPEKDIFSYRDIQDYVFQFSNGWAWDKLYKKEFIVKEKLQFQNLRTSNDLFFVYTSLVKAKRIMVMNEVLVHQRRNNKASLSSTRSKSWNCFYEALVEVKRELLRSGVYPEVERSFINRALNFSIWNLNTIKGDKKKKVYRLIRNNILREFSIDQHKREYFYNGGDYNKLVEIRDNTYLMSLWCTILRRMKDRVKSLLKG